MEDVVHTGLMLITDMGDSALLAMVVIAVSACLLIQGARREALVFFSAFIATSLCISAAKIVLMGCDSHLRELGLRSPSGHSALSLTVYGSLAFLLRNRLKGFMRYLPLCTLLPLGLIIALSRVTLGFHTKEEVIAGILIGSLVLVTAELFLKRKPSSVSPAAPLVISTAAIMLLMHGYRLPAETLLHFLAGHFHTLAHCN